MRLRSRCSGSTDVEVPSSKPQEGADRLICSNQWSPALTSGRPGEWGIPSPE